MREQGEPVVWERNHQLRSILNLSLKLRNLDKKIMLIKIVFNVRINRVLMTSIGI